MLRKNHSLFLAASFVVTLGFLAIAPTARGASAEQVLYSFAGGTSGGTPSAGLVFDSSGNLYGTTQLGGAHNRGTVFELSPSENGAWTNTILNSFAGGEDGASAVLPTLLPLFELTGTRLIRVAGFAFWTVSSIETQRHGCSVASPAIAR